MAIEVTNVHCELYSQPFVKTLITHTFPIKISFHLSRSLSKLRQEAVIYLEVKNSIIQQHASKNELGHVTANKDGSVVVSNLSAFMKDLMELQRQEIALEGIDRMKVSISELPDLTIEELDFITPFFEFLE